MENFVALDADSVISAVKSIRGGTFCSITYKSVKDTVTDRKLIKVTETVARTKINPTHRKSYVAPANPKTNNNQSIVPYAIHTNLNKGSTLFGIYPNWKQTKVTYYDEDGTEVPKDVAKAMLKPEKYSKDELPSYITVKIENVLRVGKAK